jgi:hypothetical protein
MNIRKEDQNRITGHESLVCTEEIVGRRKTLKDCGKEKNSQSPLMAYLANDYNM